MGVVHRCGGVGSGPVCHSVHVTFKNLSNGVDGAAAVRTTDPNASAQDPACLRRLMNGVAAQLASDNGASRPPCPPLLFTDLSLPGHSLPGQIIA